MPAAANICLRSRWLLTRVLIPPLLMMTRGKSMNESAQ